MRGPRPILVGIATDSAAQVDTSRVTVPLGWPTTALCALGGLWQAVDAPVGVQLGRRHQPRLAFGGALGHGAELGHQPSGRVQRHRPLVHVAPPSQLAGHQPLTA
jgi:hypothetical protein